MDGWDKHTMKCWHVTMWAELYESAQSRGVQTLSFYAKPNKLVGEGLGHTLAQEDGLALLGTWALIEALASHGLPKQRGWLFRNGSPLDAPRISALLRLPKDPVERALKHFSTTPMDWLEEAEYPFVSASSQRADSMPSASSQRADSISTRLMTEREMTDETDREREENGGFASKGDARKAQQTQFAALSSRLTTLKAVPEDERDAAHAEDLKKTRRLLNRLQKKQAHGDFTPVSGGPPLAKGAK